jgi:ABC-type nitrate/sulfonate/bicarbonate transport system substrate-binding protein
MLVLIQPLTVCRAAPAQTFKLAHVSIAGQQLPIYIGISAGLFKKHRLDEQLIYIPGGSLIVQTMVAGEVAAAGTIPDLSAKAATLNLDGFIDNSLFQELEKDGFIKDLYAAAAR